MSLKKEPNIRTASHEEMLDVFNNPFDYIDYDEAMNEIERALLEVSQLKGKILVGHSGGKDSIVVDHLLKESDLEYESLLVSYGTTSTHVEPDVTRVINCGFDWDWYVDKPQYLFTQEPRFRNKLWARGHQKVIRQEGQNYDIVILGRRLKENTVKSKRYKVGDTSMYFPIRDWGYGQLFAYIKTRGIELPHYYFLPHGMTRDWGWEDLAEFPLDEDEAWEAIKQYDPIQLERASKYFEKARIVYENRNN